ncbi:metal-dependent transcriptional regulator [Candidatus Micrarchaeota archaeon]|nr:metal-dependent transcriptional regulator [Candidatus Micrarchaeota archaeon]
MSINESRQDYVRAIFVLSERNQEVRSKDLVSYLEVKKNTVSHMLSALRDEGFVSFQNYGSISLTKKGLLLAKQLTAKHRLIELFLTKVLKRNPSEVHDEACKLEHDFSEDSLKEMKKLLGNPSLDPHGKPISV